MKLSDVAHGRDNNFNLIRVLAALSVLISHSFALTSGNSDAQPFSHTLGMTLGTMAVDVFFITSGYLVTASLLSRKNAVEFVIARMLRIYPGLLVMLLLTVFGLGAYFTVLPLSSYLANGETYHYLRRCLTLINGVSFELPGVFRTLPLKGEVNSSLWTLPYEIRMYGILLLLWMLDSLWKSKAQRVFDLVVMGIAIVAGGVTGFGHVTATAVAAFWPLAFMFFSGSMFYVLKKRVILSKSVFLVFVFVLLVASINPRIFGMFYMLLIGYVLFFLAYVPSGWIRKYNTLGDYSYGIYIYAFPVQQTVVALYPGISLLHMTLISMLVTLCFAVLSWHFVERHALKLKSVCIQHIEKAGFGYLGNRNN